MGEIEIQITFATYHDLKCPLRRISMSCFFENERSGKIVCLPLAAGFYDFPLLINNIFGRPD